MEKKRTYKVIGLMSGSSLDGLDICCVEFAIGKQEKENDKASLDIAYKIVATDCIEFNQDFVERIQRAPQLSAFEFARLHTEVGRYFGQLTHNFIQDKQLDALDFIASHGQTVFHQPNLGFTTQIGCGAQIAAQTCCSVVCDFRTADVAYGGQGAPLVPIVEKYLFPHYSAFLNIGGICNLSLHLNSGEILGYDVCAGNTLLNFYALKKGMPYDESGNLARSGDIIPELVQALNDIAFCITPPPKSLGSEHVYEEWIARCEKQDARVEDILATAVEHIAVQVGKAIHQYPEISTLLLSGGGALNTYLAERIQAHCEASVIIPNMETIQYKEALLMAFCGLLRILEIPNSIASVTGAKKNAIGGAIYFP